jgi:hypothetical protein
MSSAKQSSRTITVNPSARRCGVDNQGEVGIKQDLGLESLVTSISDSQEFLAVSDRLLKFAEIADVELANLQRFASANDAAGLEASAQRLTNLASEVGAAELIRVGYQLLINLRQGELAKAVELTTDVATEYVNLRKQLRLS